MERRWSWILSICLFMVTAIAAYSQPCGPSGNVAIFSNYDGGPLVINVNQNIPNLKIGISSYEPVSVTFTGAFVGNVTEVIYAGFQPFQPGNDHCSGVIITSIVAPPNATAQVLNYPPVTLLSPLVDDFGFTIPAGDNNGILGCYSCSNDTYQGGANTAEQIIDFFLSEFAGDLLFLKTQYECWCGEQNLDQPPTCCQELNSSVPAVTITATPSLSLCDATSINLSAGPGFSSYSWSNGASTQSTNVTNPGTYSVTVESDCGTATTQVVVTPCGNTPLSVVVPDQVVCQGESAVLEAIVSGGTPPYSYTWIPNLGNGPGPYFMPIVAPFTDYTVVVTDATGTTVSTQGTVVGLIDDVFAGLGPDQDLCNGPVTLNAALPTAQGYSWSTGATTPSITVNTPGVYFVTVFGQCSDATDEIEILPCILPLQVSLQEVTVCQGLPASLTANVQGGVGPYSYVWTPNVGNSALVTVTPATTSTYTVTVTDAEGTQATATATVTVIVENLTIDLGPDTELCNPPVVLNATNANAQSYLWNTGATTPTISVSNAGAYSVTLEGQCGNFTDNIQVLECNQLTLQLAGTNLCAGQATSLQAIVAGGEPPYQFVWTPNIGTGPGPHPVSPLATSTYTVSVTDAEGTNIQAAATVTVIPSTIEFAWSEALTICPNQLVVLSAQISTPASYLWSTGSTAPTINVTEAGTYSVSVTTPCTSAQRQVEVSLIADAEVPPYQSQFLSCIEDGPVVIGLPFGFNYPLVWDDGSVGSTLEATETGVFVATFDGPCGLRTLSFNVDLEQCTCDVYVPNAFTPNGDGLNELFRPVVGCETSEYSFIIFNRWGDKVFETNNPRESWRGNAPGSDFYAPEGVYAWQLSIQPLRGKLLKRPIERSGTIMLIR